MEQEVVRRNIRNILDHFEISAYALSKKAGMNSNTINRFLAGYSKSISSESIKRMSEALDIDPSSFKTGKIVKAQSLNDNSPINKDYMKKAISILEKEFKSIKLTSQQEDEILTRLYSEIAKIGELKKGENQEDLKVEKTFHNVLSKIAK